LQLGVSTGLLRHQFPNLVVIAVKRFNAHRMRLRTEGIRTVRLALANGLLEDYVSGLVPSQDALVELIVKRCGVTTRLARLEISRSLEQSQAVTAARDPQAAPVRPVKY
jgi:hypothetical protein